jgi:hypothetical protein
MRASFALVAQTCVAASRSGAQLRFAEQNLARWAEQERDDAKGSPLEP